MELILIAAMTKDRVIGNVTKNKQEIPWGRSYPEDIRRFREITIDHPVIMGRVTYESLKRPLDKRTNIVVSKKLDQIPKKNLIICRSIDIAIEKAKELKNPYKKIYSIGGQEIYNQTINLADKLDITEIEKNYKGNRYFPIIDNKIWKEDKRIKKNGFSFVTYSRR